MNISFLLWYSFSTPLFFTFECLPYNINTVHWVGRWQLIRKGLEVREMWMVTSEEHMLTCAGFLSLTSFSIDNEGQTLLRHKHASFVVSCNTWRGCACLFYPNAMTCTHETLMARHSVCWYMLMLQMCHTQLSSPPLSISSFVNCLIKLVNVVMMTDCYKWLNFNQFTYYKERTTSNTEEQAGQCCKGEEDRRHASGRAADRNMWKRDWETRADTEPEETN